MNILISNDDGYQATGIVALYEALKDLGRVEVVAPEQNNSAKSNALTLHSPLYVHQASNGFRYINGTPADCVHIALTGLLGYKPDLVVSGINGSQSACAGARCDCQWIDWQRPLAAECECS